MYNINRLADFTRSQQTREKMRKKIPVFEKKTKKRLEKTKSSAKKYTRVIYSMLIK